MIRITTPIARTAPAMNIIFQRMLTTGSRVNSVANPPDGLDELRFTRVLLDLLADPKISSELRTMPLFLMIRYSISNSVGVRETCRPSTGLGEVIVGAGGEPHDLADVLGARAQHQDRDVRVLAELPAQRQAVLPGHHDVQDGQVDLLLAEHFLPFISTKPSVGVPIAAKRLRRPVALSMAVEV